VGEGKDNQPTQGVLMKLRVSLVLLVCGVTVFLVSSVVLAQRPAVFDLKFGSLSGAKEVGGGDLDGFGTASGTLVEPATLCYSFTVKGIGEPVAAHIHRGRRGVNGPIVIPLTAPATGDPGTTSGCVHDIAPELMQDLAVHPDKYYWNVHTTEYPGGAIRGQVFNHR
jgi:hypothetical protein